MDFMQIFRKQETVSKQQLKANKSKPSTDKRNAAPKNIKLNVKVDKTVVVPKIPVKSKDNDDYFENILNEYDISIIKILEQHKCVKKDQRELQINLLKLDLYFKAISGRYEDCKDQVMFKNDINQNTYIKQLQIYEDNLNTITDRTIALHIETDAQLSKAKLLYQHKDKARKKELVELRKKLSKAELEYQDRDKVRKQELVELRKKLSNPELDYQKRDKERKEKLVELREKLLQSEVKIAKLEEKTTNATSPVFVQLRTRTHTRPKNMIYK